MLMPIVGVVATRSTKVKVRLDCRQAIESADAVLGITKFETAGCLLMRH